MLLLPILGGGIAAVIIFVPYLEVYYIQVIIGYSFITKWGSSGSADGQFNSPYGVAVDSSGNVYVADMVTTVFKNSPATVHSSQSGVLKVQLMDNSSSPKGVAVDSSGNVYVADTGNDRIQKFTSNGTFITKWGSNGNGDGQFSYLMVLL